MAIQLTASDAKQSLISHVESKGIEAFLKYGPEIGWGSLQRLIVDRAFVRYPCEIVFDGEQLLPGEFALPVQKGDTPEEGFRMCVHPIFMAQLDVVPALVLYQLVAVNYGQFASSDDAETFGAAALGLTRDEYYSLICDCADQLSPAVEPSGGSAAGTSCGAGCGCH